MIIACHVPSDGGLLPGVILGFVPKRGLAPGDTFLDKKNNQKDFFDPIFKFFTRPGRRTLPGRARAVACRWDLAEER